MTTVAYAGKADQASKRNFAVGATGFKDCHKIKVAVHFDEEMFRTIRDAAMAKKISYSEQVRRLLRHGLQTAAD